MGRQQSFTKFKTALSIFCGTPKPELACVRDFLPALSSRRKSSGLITQLFASYLTIMLQSIRVLQDTRIA